MSGAERTTHAATPLSVWGMRLAAALSVALAVALVWLWMETFYRGVSANVQLSFKSFDVPAVPGVRFTGPVFGHHYFGDFQVPLGYARGLRHGLSPYSGPAPEQYPPFVQALFVPLTYLPLHTSAATYLAASALVFLVPLFLLLSPAAMVYRIILLIPAAVLTTPFIAFLDRGNNIGITLGLVAFAVWAWKTEHGIWCGVFLALAIALKVYPAALLVVPFALRRYKFTVVVAAAAAAANLLVLTTYHGGFFHNVRAIGPALKSVYSPLSQLSSWSLYSLVPKTAGLLFGPSTADRLLASQSIFTWVPAVLYVAAVFFLIRRGRVPQWCWGPLALASIQLCVPVSYVYTTAWAALGAVWYSAGQLIDREGEPAAGADSEFVALRVLLLLALTATLVPSVFTISGSGSFEVPLTNYLSPALILVTVCVAVVQSLRPARATAVPAPV